MKNIRDKDGIFRILGLGSVASLAKQLSLTKGESASEDDIVHFKSVLIKGLGELYSAVSTDLIYGYRAISENPEIIRGLVLSVQKRPFNYIALGQRDWKSDLITGWVVSRENLWHADAFKVTVFYRKDLERRIRNHQESVVMFCAEKCNQLGVPLILEIMSQPLTEQEKQTPQEYARVLPDIVHGYVDEFSNLKYGVDVLKIDFPADLNYCSEYIEKEKISERALYDLTDIYNYCKIITKCSPVPWIILSGGVSIEQFETKVRIACSCGASGFIGGRSLWQGAVSLFPRFSDIGKWIKTDGTAIYSRIFKASDVLKSS
jgi:tagatose 1,6-diphosphate aldolase